MNKFMQVVGKLLLVEIAGFSVLSVSFGQTFEEYVLSNSDFVGVVIASEIIDSEFELPILKNRDVRVVFEIERVFKQPESESANYITVIMPSDMLIYPGEEKSRYNKRHEILEEIRPRLLELNGQAQALGGGLKNGSISQAEYDSRMSVIGPELSNLAGQVNSMTVGTLAITHGKSFYELGGRIEPESDYLVFLNKDEHGDYRLTPAVSYNDYVFWDDQATERIRNLEAILGL